MVEGDVARRDARHRGQIGVAKALKPLRGLCRQRGIPHAAPLQLPQEVAGIVGGVGVTEHVEIEEDESVSRPQELPGRHVPVNRGGIDRIESGCRRLEHRHEGFDDRCDVGPALAQSTVSRPRFFEQHLRGGGVLRNHRQLMKGRRQSGGLAQQRRLPIVHDLR